jgi:beta-barrel assembly-enhancing protease
MLFRSLVTVLAAVALTAQERQLGQGVNFYSKEKEAALGAGLAEDARRQTTKLDNPEVQAYVERVGRRLAAHLPDTSLTFTFAVITDDRGGPTHEPIAIPGGYLFVPTSLVLAAQDEAEFAGMLAHAMIHVAARHGTREARRSQIAHETAIPLIYIGGVEVARILLPAGILKMWRANELEADRVAIPTMAAAGYDPAALVRYISRVQPETTVQTQVHSPLPAREQRIAAMEEAIGKLGDFARIQQTVRDAMPKPQERRPPTLSGPNER